VGLPPDDVTRLSPTKLGDTAEHTWAYRFVPWLLHHVAGTGSRPAKGRAITPYQALAAATANAQPSGAVHTAQPLVTDELARVRRNTILLAHSAELSVDVGLRIGVA